MHKFSGHLAEPLTRLFGPHSTVSGKKTCKRDGAALSMRCARPEIPGLTLMAQLLPDINPGVLGRTFSSSTLLRSNLAAVRRELMSANGRAGKPGKPTWLVVLSFASIRMLEYMIQHLAESARIADQSRRRSFWSMTLRGHHNIVLFGTYFMRRKSTCLIADMWLVHHVSTCFKRVQSVLHHVVDRFNVFFFLFAFQGLSGAWLCFTRRVPIDVLAMLVTLLTTRSSAFGNVQ